MEDIKLKGGISQMTEGHCNSTCQLHEGTQERIATLEQEVHGKEGLIACTAKMLETLTTVKNLMYGMVGVVGTAALIGMVNILFNLVKVTTP
jgi:hypothetical protein